MPPLANLATLLSHSGTYNHLGTILPRTNVEHAPIQKCRDKNTTSPLCGRLEGAESLAPAAFSSENVSLDFKEPQDGKLKFTATPAVDNAKSFFMKVKVK